MALALVGLMAGVLATLQIGLIGSPQGWRCRGLWIGYMWSPRAEGAWIFPHTHGGQEARQALAAVLWQRPRQDRASSPSSPAAFLRDPTEESQRTRREQEW